MQRHSSWLRRLSAPAIRRGGAFGRNERAAVAVEFAILALPFFTIVAAILETALVLFAGQILESAVQDSSRQLRTGQAQQTSGYDAQAYRDAICAGLYGMFDCDSESEKLLVKVDVLESFGDVSASVNSPVGSACATVATACEWTVEESFDPGSGEDIVVVQAYYKWPTIVNLPWFNLATQAGNSRLLSAVRVFMNEPFS
jgi:Flp pilus assembly protein TadG